MGAYLCGDTHQISVPPEQLFIPLESIRSQKGLKIPNIVSAKGISEIDDTFSDFGIFWHKWEETGTVNARFFRWRREFSRDLHSDAGYDFNYEMLDKHEITLDPDFANYIEMKFNERKKKNIAVRTPQLILWTLQYPDSEALEIFNYYKHNGKRCGDIIIQELDKIDKLYLQEGRQYQERYYHDYQHLLFEGIQHSASLLRYEEYISPRLFCSFVLDYSNGSTIEMLKQYFDRFDAFRLHMRNGEPPSVPASYTPNSNQMNRMDDMSWIEDI